jgi:hypothetical protein
MKTLDQNKAPRQSNVNCKNNTGTFLWHCQQKIYQKLSTKEEYMKINWQIWVFGFGGIKGWTEWYRTSQRSSKSKLNKSIAGILWFHTIHISGEWIESNKLLVDEFNCSCARPSSIHAKCICTDTGCKFSGIRRTIPNYVNNSLKQTRTTTCYSIVLFFQITKTDRKQLTKHHLFN